MNLVYRKANINDIDDLVDFKIKQNIFTCNREGTTLKNEDLARKNIKNILMKELNKTIYFYIAIDESNNK